MACAPIGLVASAPLRNALFFFFMEDVGNKLGNGGKVGNVTMDGTLGLVVDSNVNSESESAFNPPQSLFCVHIVPFFLITSLTKYSQFLSFDVCTTL